MRADLLLVKKNLVSTRTLAQELIKNGQVEVIILQKKRLVTKPSEDIPEGSEFEITAGFANEFVSRAGHKLKGAFQNLDLQIENKVCLDIGVSTGGFTDFLLKFGAKQVVGIDVGQDQTHELIKSNPRFVLLEKTNARALSENKKFQELVPENGFDFICMDVSFISVKLILPNLRPLLAHNGQLLVLIKPQFELGPDALNEKGIIKNPVGYVVLEKAMIEESIELGFKTVKYFSSSIDGKDGNKEFFLFLSHLDPEMHTVSFKSK